MSKSTPVVVVIVAVVLGIGIREVLGQAAPAPARPGPAAAPAAQPAAGFQPGQKVEVREGDAWSPATLLKREGRRYQIQYDDNTEEWLTVDRLRLPGAAPAAGAPAAPTAATPTPTASAAPREPAWSNGQKVSVKWGGLWFDSLIKNKGNGWYLVEYQRTGGYEWVEPWRIRPAGSNEDTIPYASPGKRLQRPEPPPAVQPRPRPAAERSGAGAADADPTVSEHAPTKEVDRSSVHEIILGTSAADWALTPDPAPAASGLSQQPAVLRGASDSVFEEMTAPRFAASAGQAILMYFQSAHGQRAAVERVDLKSARSLGVAELPVVITAADVSDDGIHLLGRTAGMHFGEGARLDVWKIDSAQPTHVVSFLPYGDQERHRRNITWARYVGPERAATMNGDGKLIVWDLSNAKSIWSTDVANVTPALSGSGKQLAVVVESQLIVINSADGKTLASLSLSTRPRAGRLSFRPDGKQLAMVSDGTLSVFEAATGKLHSETPFDVSAGSIDWPADGYVLIDGSTLLDLTRKMPLWQYKGAKSTGTYSGRTWYVASLDPGGKKPVLASATLPGDEVKRAATGADTADIWAAKPGTGVTLDTSALPGDIQAEVTEALKARLLANGFAVADGQPIRLVASVEAGEAKEIRYRGFGESPFSGGTTITATPQTSKLAFVDAEGKTLWQRQVTKHPPMMASLKEGQSIEQYVADATKPDAHFYKGVVLPKFVAKAQYRNGLGVSQFTARGVTESKQAALGQ